MAQSKIAQRCDDRNEIASECKQEEQALTKLQAEEQALSQQLDELKVKYQIQSADNSAVCRSLNVALSPSWTKKRTLLKQKRIKWKLNLARLCKKPSKLHSRLQATWNGSAKRTQNLLINWTWSKTYFKARYEAFMALELSSC